MLKFPNKFFDLLVFAFVAAAFSACSQNETNNPVEENVNKSAGGIAVPKAISAAALPADGTLTAYIYLDDQDTPLDQKAISLDATEVSFTLTVPTGEHTFEILFEFADQTFGTFDLAYATSNTIDVGADPNQTVDFLEENYTYDDDDQDDLTNLAEIEAGTDPDNPDTTAPTTSASHAGGTYNAVSVDLTCTDNTNGSGCNIIYITTDLNAQANEFDEYNNTAIEISVNTTLRFYSVDMAGNKEGIQSEQYIIDTTPPVASNPQPAANATDVALSTTEITINFSEDINPATINPSTFLLSNPLGPVSGSVSFDEGTNTATFTLAENLVDATSYTATLTTGVEDIAGNALASNFSWSFDSANIIWIGENGSIVKLSSAQEELSRVDQVNCSGLSGIAQFAIDPNDNALWVSDTNNDRIFKIEKDGKLQVLHDQFSVQGTAVDPRDGSVWSSEYLGTGNGRKLIKRSVFGTPILESGPGLGGSMMDNAMDWLVADNSLWYADYSTNVVKILDSMPNSYDASGVSGTHHLRISGFVGQPFSVSAYQGDGMGGAGHIWAADRGNAIVKLLPDGTEELRRTPSGFFEVRHVSADISDGSVWAAAGNPDRVAKYSASGDALANVGGFSAPFGAIEADPFDGGAWVGYSGGLVKLSGDGSEEWRREIGRVSFMELKTARPSAITHHVSENGDDTSGDGTFANPFSTIGRAISEASAGDTIKVGAGTYNENVSVTLKSRISIIGSGADSTIIQGKGTTDVVSFVDVDNAKISKFTITNNSSGQFAGIYCADCRGVIIRNNKLINNGAPSSTTSNGIEIQSSSEVLVEQNLISGNASGGMYIAGTSRAIIRNNIIANNQDVGIYSGFGSNPSEIANNVIDSNGTESFGRSGLMLFSDDTVKGNIISNNGSDNPNAGLAVGIYVGSNAVPVLSYNNVWNNFQGPYTNITAGTGDISADPLFAGVDDYHLNAGSPSLNSGDPAIFDAAIDCANTTERRSDMGAYGGLWGNW